MLCITGNESTTAAIAARVHRVDAKLSGRGIKSWMHELRLDHLDELDESIFSLIRSLDGRALVTCRPTRMGGRFEEEESERIALLARAQLAGARYVDVEHDVRDDQLTNFDRSRLVLSLHDHVGVPSNLLSIAQDMAARGPSAIKLCCQIQHVEQLRPLHQIARRARQDQLIGCFIGMGIAGLVSRSHYRRFGSDWTYLCEQAPSSTAEGQLDLEEALRLGLPQSAGRPFFALIGGPQVLESPGPRTYATLLKTHRIRSSYIPIVAEDLPEAVDLLAALGATGLSVTMPFKRAAMTLGTPDARATRAGAANSLYRTDQGWMASNTDIHGVEAPLGRALDQVTRVSGRATRALVLGTGGAARAAVIACKQLELDYTVAGRNLEAANRTAGPEARGIAWEDRTHEEHDILINATALAGDQCPWPDNAAIEAQIVFDLALSSTPSRLLERARSHGAITLDALQMWLHQGAEQMSLFLNRPISVHELKRVIQRPSSTRTRT